MTSSPFTTAIAAAVLALTAQAALAQSTITGVSDLDDRLTDIEQDAQDELDRGSDDYRFGNPEFRPGLSGSASLSFTSNDGNDESRDFIAGARLRYAQGQTVQTLGFAVESSEIAGTRTKENLFAVYDFNYYFDERLYAFVLGRLEQNSLATMATDVRTDGFLGFGPGYRVVNTPEMTWRVQAGIGVSYLEDGMRDATTETGYIASSRFYYQLGETIFMTNDTDILKSDSALRINNDLGLNFKLTEAFATRISYLSEYNDSRAIRTDNKVGLAVVFSF